MKAELGSVILWVLALYVSKCAAIVFMSRFASPGRHKKEIMGVLCAVAALGLGAMLALMVDCRVVSGIFYWDFPSHESFCPAPVRTSYALSTFF